MVETIQMKNIEWHEDWGMCWFFWGSMGGCDIPKIPHHFSTMETEGRAIFYAKGWSLE
jgi:hypothetical protein